MGGRERAASRDCAIGRSTTIQTRNGRRILMPSLILTSLIYPPPSLQCPDIARNCFVSQYLYLSLAMPCDAPSVLQEAPTKVSRGTYAPP